MKLFSQYKGLRKEIYVLFVSKIVTCMGAMVHSMLTSILSIHLGMTASQIINWTMVLVIVQMPFIFIGGKLADKFNKKKILIYTDIFESIIYIGCAIFPFSKITMIVYLAGSILENLSSPAYGTLLMDLTTAQDRKRANSLLYLGNNIGMVLAPTISGFLINKNINLIFLINGIATIIALIFETVALKDITAIVDDSNKYEAPRENVSLKQVLKENKLIIIFVFLFSIEMLVYDEYSFILPLDLNATYLENGTIYYGFMSSINCITVVLCTSIMTKLFNKVSDISQFSVGVSLFAVGYILMATFISNIWICYLAIFIFTLGEILCTISGDVLISKRVPMTHRGRISSFNQILGTIVYLLGQYPISRIYDYKGSKITWIVIISLTLFVPLMLSILRKKDEETYPDLYKFKYENKTTES